jgi:integrase/recombinase XerC/integrase/recombinase XerD
MPLTALLDCFIVNQRLKNNSEKTIHGYGMFIKVFFVWLKECYGLTDADALTLNHVNEYQLYLRNKSKINEPNRMLSPKTVQTYMRHIKVFLRFCYDEELITADIAKKMVMPKAGKPVIEILTDSEADVLLGSFNTRTMDGMRNYCICLLMLDCGLRVSEVCGLKISDINLEAGYAKVTGKGSKGRVVPVGVKCRKALLKYIYRCRYNAPTDYIAPMGAGDYMFIMKNGKKMTGKSVVELFRKLKKRLNIPRIHAHLLRHTFATNFLLSGLGDVYQLSQLLGHGDIKTTQIYLHSSNYYKMVRDGSTRTYWDLK